MILINYFLSIWISNGCSRSKLNPIFQVFKVVMLDDDVLSLVLSPYSTSPLDLARFARVSKSWSRVAGEMLTRLKPRDEEVVASIEEAVARASVGRGYLLSVLLGRNLSAEVLSRGVSLALSIGRNDLAKLMGTHRNWGRVLLAPNACAKSPYDVVSISKDYSWYLTHEMRVCIKVAKCPSKRELIELARNRCYRLVAYFARRLNVNLADIICYGHELVPHVGRRIK